MKKTKIICTIGPKNANPEALKLYAENGMGVARLNGSHNTLEWHSTTISMVQDVLPKTPILLDVPGKKIRTLILKHEPSFHTNDLITLTTDQTYQGEKKAPISHESLHQYLTVGDTIYADDGQLAFKVESLKDKDITLQALCSGTLKSRKGINIPNANLGSEYITHKDKEMLKFACECNVDFVGISFVESEAHINSIRHYLDENTPAHFSPPKIVAKVENLKGLENLNQIVQSADIIMIDRGDLAVETDLTHVVLYQKSIIATAHQYGVPVIIATEMLHTMINQPTPTKAEISDITNAILDHASAIMLSGETAIGNYGLEAVQLMNNLTQVVPSFSQVDPCSTEASKREKYYTHVINSAKQLCDSLPITKIVTISRSGFAARMMSTKQPRQEILCVTDDKRVSKTSNIFYGTTGVFTEISFSQNTISHVEKILNELIAKGLLNQDDFILVLFVSYPKKGNLTNSLQLHFVRDLIEIFNQQKASI